MPELLKFHIWNLNNFKISKTEKKTILKHSTGSEVFKNVKFSENGPANKKIWMF